MDSATNHLVNVLVIEMIHSRIPIPISGLDRVRGVRQVDVRYHLILPHTEIKVSCLRKGMLQVSLLDMLLSFPLSPILVPITYPRWYGANQRSGSSPVVQDTPGPGGAANQSYWQKAQGYVPNSVSATASTAGDRMKSGVDSVFTQQNRDAVSPYPLLVILPPSPSSHQMNAHYPLLISHLFAS